jgi:hypothetical protein
MTRMVVAAMALLLAAAAPAGARAAFSNQGQAQRAANTRRP